MLIRIIKNTCLLFIILTVITLKSCKKDTEDGTGIMSLIAFTQDGLSGDIAAGGSDGGSDSGGNSGNNGGEPGNGGTIGPDFDGDGIPDVDDLDDDNDGVNDDIDVDDDNDGLIEIHFIEELNNIRNDLDGSHYNDGDTASDNGCPASGCIGYELTKDLDFKDPDSYATQAVDPVFNTSSGWEAIGDNTNPFSAIFEGNNHSIVNLYVHCYSSLTNYTGLFGVIDSPGDVRNVALINVQLYGVGGSGILATSTMNAGTGYQAHAGAIAGINLGTISNSRASGVVIGYGGGGGQSYYYYQEGGHGGNANVGGLVGTNLGFIETSLSSVEINGYGGTGSSSGYAGSYNTIGGDAFVGGLVGTNFGSISNSFATGLVDGKGGRGGCCAYEIGGHGGDGYFGGLVGYAVSGNSITNSYSIGQVLGLAGDHGWTGDPVVYSDGYNGYHYSGGLIGHRETGNVLNSYWDIVSTGMTTSSGGIGKTTTEMKCLNDTDTTWDTVIWDFGDCSVYPGLILNQEIHRP